MTKEQFVKLPFAERRKIELKFKREKKKFVDEKIVTNGIVTALEIENFMNKFIEIQV